MIEAANYYNKAFLNSEQGKNQILDGVVKETVMLETAKKSGYNKTEDYKTKFKNFEKQVLITELIKNLRDKELKVSDEDIKKEYDKNKAYYDAPKEIKVSHILLNNKEEADKVLKKLKGEKDDENEYDKKFNEILKELETVLMSIKVGDDIWQKFTNDEIEIVSGYQSFIEKRKDWQLGNSIGNETSGQPGK
jgi:hypothetical protein